MTARERILMIRLTEKLEKNPGVAKALAIEVTGGGKDQNMKHDPRGLAAV